MNKGICSPKARKATKKRLAKEKLQKEKKLENKTEEEIEIAVNNEVSLEDSYPRGEKIYELRKLEKHEKYSKNLEPASAANGKTQD